MEDYNLEELWQLSEEQLLLGLGNSVGDHRFGARPSDIIQQAKDWLDKQRPDICEMLSKIPGLAQLIQDQSAARRLEAFGSAIDILAVAYGKTTAIWASLFVLRVGLADFCSERTGPKT